MNSGPEWFTVEPDETHRYQVEDVEAGTTQLVSGKSLHEGLPVRLEPQKPLKLIVQPE